VKKKLYKCSNSGRNESSSQTQNNVSWISSKAELEISFMTTRLEMWVWESGPRIDPATCVKNSPATGVRIRILRNFFQSKTSLSNLVKFQGNNSFPEGFVHSKRWPHPQILVVFGSFLGNGPNFCLDQSCSPWIWTKLFRHVDTKVGGKGTATRWGCRITQNWQ